MPVMQQPEAYLSNVSDDSSIRRPAQGRQLKEFLEKIAHAFHDWVEMIHRSRQLLAEDAAHASAKAKEHA